MFKEACKSFLADRTGSTAITIAILMPLIVGGFGLGVEVSMWYFTQRKLQNAADVAAYAGAVQLRKEKNLAAIDGAAELAALKTGFKASIGSITTQWPAVSGAYAGNPNAVEIAVAENVPRSFSSIFGSDAVAMSGRAVALLQQGAETCILALDPGASGAVTVTGAADAVLDGCNLHSNSLADDSLIVSGSAQVKTPCVSAVGTVSADSGLAMDTCNSPIEHADPIDDPYAGVPEPSTSGTCEPQNVFAGAAGSSYTISAGRYCGGLTMKRNVTMNPGVYVVDGGDLRIDSTALVTGVGVTFFLTNGGRVVVNGDADVRLSAPTSGTYSGMMIFVDRDDPYATHTINGSATSYFEGSIYAPSGQVRLAGGNTISARCTQIVAATVEITGSSGLGSDCTGKGVTSIMTEQLVMLVE